MHRQEVAAVDPVEDAGAAADQGFALGAAGQPDDDPLPGRPAGFDAVSRPIPCEPLVHPVRQPQQGQLTQGRQVARTVVVGERGIDPVSRDDLAVREALPQEFGGDVHQLDLPGPPGDLIGHALRRPDVGDGADDVAEGREMLDVQGGQDVDAGVEQFINILPAVGVRAVRGVGVGVVIDDGRGGAAADDRVQVELFEVEPSIRNPPALDQLESLPSGTGCRGAPGPGRRRRRRPRRHRAAGAPPGASRRSSRRRVLLPGRCAAFHVPWGQLLPFHSALSGGPCVKDSSRSPSAGETRRPLLVSQL